MNIYLAAPVKYCNLLKDFNIKEKDSSTKRKIDSTLFSSRTCKKTSNFEYSSREYQPTQETAKSDFIETLQRDIHYVIECKWVKEIKTYIHILLNVKIKLG